jgi:hypothetical protein
MCYLVVFRIGYISSFGYHLHGKLSLHINYIPRFSILKSRCLHQASNEAISHLNNYRAGKLNYIGSDVKLIYKCWDK